MNIRNLFFVARRIVIPLISALKNHGFLVTSTGKLGETPTTIVNHQARREENLIKLTKQAITRIFKYKQQESRTPQKILESKPFELPLVTKHFSHFSSVVVIF